VVRVELIEFRGCDDGDRDALLNVVVVAAALAVAASAGVSAQDVSILGMAWTSSPLRPWS
jgi:hypothetical protein